MTRFFLLAHCCRWNHLGRELYDHRGDPGELDWAGEHVNVVDQPENTATVARLHTAILGYIQLK